ncbi:MAG: tRNA uridine-5-carboxymethylaminomethyl(34) synthesis GTPase MnmE [bacterium]|nr:tRNA uridine-5-carboxymethylaminomethyl(34) synthesis GTPase MnmE [bacterium]
MKDNTISAISTPLGESGIGIVRLSGPSAIKIAEKIFVGKDKVSNFPTHTIHYGQIRDPATSELIDDVLITVMKAPKTYTREDVVEINAHGGIIPLKRILELTLEYGAELASPGEFTRRAFLNGRIDLCQAEAVIEVIRAKTDVGLRYALHQLKGDLSREIYTLRDQIVNILAYLEASIDFPEEDIERLDSTQVKIRVEEIRDRIKGLIETSKYGKLFKEGIRTVIVGRPNVGKSSLLNALLGEERAIVTSIPGTTRDTIEEAIDIEGIPLTLIDTAGLRHPIDQIEEKGVSRTRESLQLADLVILVLDGSEKLTEEDIEIIEETRDKLRIIVINKIDLPQTIELNNIQTLLDGVKIVRTSATEKLGLDDLKEGIKEKFFLRGLPSINGILITNLRHKRALQKACQSMERVIDTISNNLSEEFIALDLREALNHLGAIIGETINEDILSEIFSQFCIGK